jgi:hypothetical protein
VKPDFLFRRNGRVHLNRRGRQFSRLLAAEVCASTVIMLDTPCSEVVWRVLTTHSIRHFIRHILTRASPCAVTFQLESTYSGSLGVADEAETCSSWKNICFRKLKIVYLVGYVIRKKYDIIPYTYPKWGGNLGATSRVGFSVSLEKNTSAADHLSCGGEIPRFCECSAPCL